MPRRKQIVNLSATHPHLLAEWHPTKNGDLAFHLLSPGSTQSVWWRCSNNPSHEWPARFAHRVNGIGCPYCSGRYATPETSLKALYPHLAEEMHPTLNGELTTEQLKPKSDKVVIWRCRLNPLHTWPAVVKSRVRGNGCPMCAHKVATHETALSTLHPDLAEEWHPTKNGTLSPADVVPGSEKRVWWRCRRNLAHEWTAIIRNRAVLKSGCPICAGQVATPETSLEVQTPALAAEWHFEKNGVLTPSQVLPKSSKKVWWRCRKDPTHEWPATIASRAAGCGCPFCAGKRARPETSLAASFPLVAEEWHPSANGELTTDQVLPGSGCIVMWRCRKDPTHEWPARIQHRANGIGCPFCSGQRATPETSLQAVVPNLAAEWHPTRNGGLTPDKVKPRSNLEVWWRCRSNPAHEWPAIIDNRYAHGSGCPHCRPQGSSLEEAFASLLDARQISYERQKEVGSYHVDFYLAGSETVVEVKGCFWHGCSQCGYNDEWHLEKRQRDATREAFLQEQGYQVMEVWEHEFEQGGAVTLVNVLAVSFQKD